MKKTIFVVLAMLYAFTLSAQDIHGFVTKQMQTYPKSRLLDIYKSCFQDYMGAEHLVSDGYRVETPIGSFAPKLKLLGEHTDLFLACTGGQAPCARVPLHVRMQRSAML